jgi:hypothetical protein
MNKGNMNIFIKYTVVLLAIVTMVFIPEQLLFREDSTLCMFNRLTGKPCALCGMTRAIFLLIRFQTPLAISFNPLVLFLPLLLMIEVLHDFFSIPYTGRIRLILWIAFCSSLVLLFLLRFFGNLQEIPVF